MMRPRFIKRINDLREQLAVSERQNVHAFECRIAAERERDTLRAEVEQIRADLARVEAERDNYNTLREEALDERNEACSEIESLRAEVERFRKLTLYVSGTALEEIPKLQAEVERLRAALALAEWGGTNECGFPECPTCHADKDDGHKDGCALKAALATQPPAEAPQTVASDDEHPPLARCPATPDGRPLEEEQGSCEACPGTAYCRGDSPPAEAPQTGALCDCDSDA